MKIESKYNPMFGFTPISDIFFTDYLPDLPPMAVKLYLVCLYLNQRGQTVNKDELAALIGETTAVAEENLIILETSGLIAIIDDRLLVQDINQRELDRLYRSRTSGAMSDEFTLGKNVINKRTEMVKCISDKFFGGQMPPSWYTEIDLWFDKFGFDPEVMYMLFQHCSQNNALTKPYLRRVADSWGEKSSRTIEQLETYLIEYDRFKTAKGQVIKKLKLNAKLDTYSEDILKKWFITYGYDFDTVELALRNAPKAKNPTLRYFDAIITKWYEAGLKKKEEVERYEENMKELSKKSSGGEKGRLDSTAQKENYDGRSYDNEFLDGLYKDVEDED